MEKKLAKKTKKKGKSREQQKASELLTDVDRVLADFVRDNPKLFLAKGGMALYEDMASRLARHIKSTSKTTFMRAQRPGGLEKEVSRETKKDDDPSEEALLPTSKSRKEIVVYLQENGSVKVIVGGVMEDYPAHWQGKARLKGLLSRYADHDFVAPDDVGNMARFPGYARNITREELEKFANSTNGNPVKRSTELYQEMERFVSEHDLKTVLLEMNSEGGPGESFRKLAGLLIETCELYSDFTSEDRLRNRNTRDSAYSLLSAINRTQHIHTTSEQVGFCRLNGSLSAMLDGRPIKDKYPPVRAVGGVVEELFKYLKA